MLRVRLKLSTARISKQQSGYGRRMPGAGRGSVGARYYPAAATGQCDGWRVEKNTAEMVTLDFENCTDKVAAVPAGDAEFHCEPRIPKLWRTGAPGGAESKRS